MKNIEIPEALTPFEVDRLLRHRITEAVIAQSRIKHSGLNDFLRAALGGEDVSNGALFTEPVLEAATGYVSSGKRPSDLVGLLHPDLIHALTHCDDPAFHFTYPAYQHQLEAWEKLQTSQRNSVLVSSGTGSGKTECFLVPMLNDLARESEVAGRLRGVRAIMLYPLNALIASQEKRLSQWTQRFDGRIRFALYNGLMTDKRERDTDRDEAKTPNQILYRNSLRKEPPPILVTNNTMLEYLTIRQEDRGIVEASQGLLRWIVIDEAHSYIGSAAAELALLLRRVMQTFGVSAGQVRIVATSATIGSNSVEDKRTLQTFLADLAGVPPEQAFVIAGAPQPIKLSPIDVGATIGSSPNFSRDGLIRHKSVHAAAAALKEGPAYVSALANSAAELNQASRTFSETLAGIAVDGPAIIPQRVHGFVRTISGLWTCLDAACKGPRPQDWPFGSIHHSAAPKCHDCDAPVFEIVSCKECSEIYLLGLDTGDKLIPRDAPPDVDEFVSASAREGETSFFEDGELEIDDVETDATISRSGSARLIAVRQLNGARSVYLNPNDGTISDNLDGVQHWCGPPHEDKDCLFCLSAPNKNGSGPLWPFRFGAPFLMQNVVPTLLSGVSAAEDQSVKLPFEGRRLISFTDSRQGTARLAANIETMGERSHVRSMIYHAAQKSGGQRPPTVLELKEIEDLSAASAVATGAVKFVLEAKLEAMATALAGGRIAWNEMISALVDNPILDQIAQVWDADRERRYSDDRRSLGRFLLLRELARRPRLANSIETLGFARLVFPDIDRLTESSLPAEFRRKGKSIQDWRDFLYFMVDWLRGSFAIRVEPEDAHWMPGGSFPRQVMPPGEAKGRPSDLSWPRVNPKGMQSNAVLALVQGLSLDIAEKEDQDIVQQVMYAAWGQLRALMEGVTGTYALDLGKAEIAATKNAWLCPVTGKVINRTIFGMSQNGFRSRHPNAQSVPFEISFPQLPLTFPSRKPESDALIHNFLAQNLDVLTLRELGIWGNWHDTAVRFAPYLRAEEHSAQQPPHRLREFEKQFAAGKINLLACSTTMEMGVDIGSIEAVLNTNVPPSIANYKQRVGRAGRRNQNFSYSMTLARDTALDKEAFSDPVAYLNRKVRAPKVSLDSTRIVQRHCNALLLGTWLREADGQLTKLKSGPFFGCREDFKPFDDESPSDTFAKWLRLPSSRQKCGEAIARLIDRTGLRGNTEVMDDCALQFEAARDAFKISWGRLADEASLATGPGKISAEIRARRMLREPLLKELANRSLLPGSGFPSAVIPFMTDSEVRKSRAASSDREEQQTSRNQRYDYPSRNADIAIREYAPGADVVIDGLVWKSAGVTLNWHRHAADEEMPQIQSLRYSWLCNDCGEAGTSISEQRSCVSCGSTDTTRDRFLEPAGFRVERSAKPHADTDNASYIEPIAPRISASGAAWQPLLDPILGRMRSTPDGLVFHLSKGRKKAGYRLCLDCGRMAEDGNDQLQNHAPLGYVKDKGSFCPGNEKTYAITDTIALGHEILTDVVELQFQNLTREGIAWAVASALREALSRSLGIEARELGLGVSARKGRLDAETHSIFLFDQASGGAGYAPRLLDLLSNLLPEASAILDCPVECQNGCSACVLASDIYGQQSKIDRRHAFEWIANLNARVVQPDPEDLVSQDAKLSPCVGDALAALMQAGDAVEIFVNSQFSIESLHQSPMLDLFALSLRRGTQVTLVLDLEQFTHMDILDRVTIRNCAQRHRFGLATFDKHAEIGRSKLLAILTQNGDKFAYYSRDHEAGIPGETWGRGLTHPVVFCPISTVPELTWIEPEELEMQAGSTDVVLPIENFPSTSVAKFGRQLAQSVIQPKLQEIGRWNPGKLIGISYSDRYLRSPLSLLLAMNTFAELRKSLAKPDQDLPCTVTTVELRDNEWRRSPYRIWDDWEEERDRTSVAQGYARKMAIDLDWRVGQAPHRRELVLMYEGGRTCRIFLDQGFGYWQSERLVKFDFGKNPNDQIHALLREGSFVKGNGQSFLAFKSD